jgi:hypothetical protein
VEESFRSIRRYAVLTSDPLDLWMRANVHNPGELTYNPVSRELKWSGKRPRLSNLTTRDLNLVYFAWMKERGD